ncbi:acyltransferase family protein [Embleya sp. NPDC127516]|uniref:acyltransferase family protein n=1 Tax=Embleya sp. NPDC127516 TaxID=3363990 RepID=UPI0037F7145C
MNMLDRAATASTPAPQAAEASRAARHRSAPGGRTQHGGGQRLAVLDGLRFVAALAVVLFHLGGDIPGIYADVWGKPYQKLMPTGHAVLAFGRLGVQLFFVISGFVICMSAWGRSPREFFVSRVSRLYPMYVVAVLGSTAALYSLPLPQSPLVKPSAETVLANLTMLQKPLGVENIDPVYWTLWVELTFYLMFAVVVWRGVTYRRVVLFCGLWTIASVIAYGIDDATLTLVVNPIYSPFFIAGMAYYLMYRFRPTPLLWSIVAMSWILSAHYALAKTSGAIPWSQWEPRKIWILVVLTGIYAAVAIVALGWTSRIRWRWLSTAGAMTFPLYLTHFVLGLIVVHHFRGRLSPPVLIACVTIGAVVLAYLLQRFVERPLGRSLRTALGREHLLAAPAAPGVAQPAQPHSKQAHEDIDHQRTPTGPWMP